MKNLTSPLTYLQLLLHHPPSEKLLHPTKLLLFLIIQPKYSFWIGVDDELIGWFYVSYIYILIMLTNICLFIHPSHTSEYHLPSLGPKHRLVQFCNARNYCCPINVQINHIFEELTLLENSWNCIYVRRRENVCVWRALCMSVAKWRSSPQGTFHLHVWDLAGTCNIPRLPVGTLKPTGSQQFCIYCVTFAIYKYVI